MHLEFVGGDPGPEIVAAVTALLTRPVVVLDDAEEDSAESVPSPWVRAARLEGIVHGRRITTRADLEWRR